MAAKRRRATRQRTQTLKQQVHDEMFWTVATIVLIAATVVFVPMLFAAIK